ncbi:alpha and gamma adaptin binding protein p34 protein [Diplodia corticola]|uniref:Alpha and gamma adaptin binding protein p34 protein n=1 Tax=Diplodia corticola TaxID=236234 RepID=A0A1J9QRX1_9PEZI|nr:alpha and gamma adaptin binding protein p34 protein [Diplodia corticola]OJD31200.1 alpha and gamma adaptin binding protein p34 protein [Diplodia corticola]
MDAPKPMEISNPRRMLVVGAPDSGVLEFLTDLTTTAPPPPRPAAPTEDADSSAGNPNDPNDPTAAAGPANNTSIAGLTHAWTLTTPYYTTTIPIWIDEIARPAAWRDDFCRPEAREVVAAVGAWVYVFRKPPADAGREMETERDRVLQTMRGIREVVEKGAGMGWDGVCLAVGVRGRAGGLVGTSEVVVAGVEEEGEGKWGAEEWEDAARERGFEYVDAEAEGRNEFGEVQGMARVREALEANEWEGDDGAGLSDFEELEGEGSGDEDWNKTFAAEEAEMGLELLGLKTELNGGDGDDADGEDQAAQVEELERMMSKLSGIKDLAAGMPEEQRKKFAAKAVNDLMKSS